MTIIAKFEKAKSSKNSDLIKCCLETCKCHEKNYNTQHLTLQQNADTARLMQKKEKEKQGNNTYG